jgi:hypothetical protein
MIQANQNQVAERPPRTLHPSVGPVLLFLAAVGLLSIVVLLLLP